MTPEIPRIRWIKKKSQLAAAHADLVASDQFQEAVNYAMLQMVLLTGDAPDMASASCRHYMLAGAKKFVEILMTLSDPEKKLPIRDLDNLPHLTT